MTGLISAFGKDTDYKSVVSGIKTELVFELGGKERRSPTGGIEYYETNLVKSVTQNGEPRLKSTGLGMTWEVPVKIGEIDVDIEYIFNSHGPAISINLKIYHADQIVRNVFFNLSIALSQGPWLLNIPGNGLRSDIRLEEVNQSVGISPLGGLRGSAALVHLSNQVQSLTLWVDNDIEIPEVIFEASSRESFDLRVKSNFGSDLSVIEEISLPLISLELNSHNFNSFVPIFAGWLQNKGINSPNNPPSWIKQTMIFEAQIGFSVFAQVNQYSPYPEVGDLIRDLHRIKSLGFSCIQLMPKQPYPSYNVHAYKDIDTSYGDREEIKRLVAEAHKLGILIIFDVLLHGVLDKEIIKVAADGVRSGPFNELINAETSDSFSSDVKDWQNYLIAWSRHILDFEPYWSAGSPSRTELEDTNPEWFYRDSEGAIAGVYTKAFDARSDSWREFFVDSMKFLVTELGIDGFRFDAPTYNDFYNWSSWTRYRAGASALACTALFEQMRPVMKAINPEFLFYTEPSGLSLRRSMDLNYNYDEQWLVTSIADTQSQKPWGVQNGQDLARWMRDRDSMLPIGSMTAHHIDSHDTFWWPTWGKKWRREQFDIQTVRALTLIFGLLPGPFMMFVGGENGIEDILPQISSLKAEDVWNSGSIHWWVGSGTPKSVFGLTRSSKGESISLLVNVSDSVVNFNPELKFEKYSKLISIGGESTSEEVVILEPWSGVVVAHKMANKE